MSTFEFGTDASFGDQDTSSFGPSEVTQLTAVDLDVRFGGVTSKGGITGSNPESGPIGELLPIYQNTDGSWAITGNRNVDAVLIGSKWGTLNLTYSFPTSGSNYNGAGLDTNGVNNYHLDLGTQQQAAARAAFAQISAYTSLTFTEITETDTVHANIRISQTADADVPSAYGGSRPIRGALQATSGSAAITSPTTISLQGHVGFCYHHARDRPHDGAEARASGLHQQRSLLLFRNFPRLGTQSLTPDRDGQAWSLMTYTPAPFTNSNFAGEKINQPQTYMQYDLAALQYMYGANYTTNAGDTVYTWSQTTGEMSINGVGQGAPSGNKIFRPSGTAAATTRSMAATTPTASPSTSARASSRRSIRPSWPTTLPFRIWSTWRPATSPCRCFTTTMPVP